MISVFLCEDSHDDQTQIRDLLARFQGARPHYTLNINCFDSGEALLAADQAGERGHLYLLDVIMPGLNGIEVARELRRRGRQGLILFLTTSRDYAVEAFGVEAFQYLLKPMEPEGLFHALDGALARLGPGLEDHFSIPTGGGEKQVPLSRILYVEQNQHVLHYHLTGGGVITSKSLRVPFEEANRKLMENRAFLRPHRSFLVNAAHIQSMGQRELTLENGERVPISRLRLADVRMQYLEYLLHRGEGER